MAIALTALGIAGLIAALAAIEARYRQRLRHAEAVRHARATPRREPITSAVRFDRVARAGDDLEVTLAAAKADAVARRDLRARTAAA